MKPTRTMPPEAIQSVPGKALGFRRVESMWRSAMSTPSGCRLANPGARCGGQGSPTIQHQRPWPPYMQARATASLNNAIVTQRRYFRCRKVEELAQHLIGMLAEHRRCAIVRDRRLRELDGIGDEPGWLAVGCGMRQFTRHPARFHLRIC